MSKQLDKVQAKAERARQRKITADTKKKRLGRLGAQLKYQEVGGTNFERFYRNEAYIHSTNHEMHGAVLDHIQQTNESIFNDVTSELIETVTNQIDELIQDLEQDEVAAKDIIRKELLPHLPKNVSSDILLEEFNKKYGNQSATYKQFYDSLKTAYDVIYKNAAELLEEGTTRTHITRKGMLLQDSIVKIQNVVNIYNMPNAYRQSLRALRMMADEMKAGSTIADSTLAAARTALGIVSELGFFAAESDARYKLVGFMDTLQSGDFDRLIAEKQLEIQNAKNKAEKKAIVNAALVQIFGQVQANAKPIKGYFTMDAGLSVASQAAKKAGINFLGIDVKRGYEPTYPLNYKTTIEKVINLIKLKSKTSTEIEYILYNAVAMTDSTGLYKLNDVARTSLLQMIIAAILASQDSNWWKNKFFDRSIANGKYPLFISIGGEYMFFTDSLRIIKESLREGLLKPNRAIGISNKSDLKTMKQEFYQTKLAALRGTGQGDRTFGYTNQSFDALYGHNDFRNQQDAIKNRIRDLNISFYTTVNLKRPK